MAKRKRKRSLNLGASPPKFWHAEIDAICPEGSKTFKYPGPSAAKAIVKATQKIARCKVTARRVVSV